MAIPIITSSSWFGYSSPKFEIYSKHTNLEPYRPHKIFRGGGPDFDSDRVISADNLTYLMVHTWFKRAIWNFVVDRIVAIKDDGAIIDACNPESDMIWFMFKSQSHVSERICFNKYIPNICNEFVYNGGDIVPCIASTGLSEHHVNVHSILCKPDNAMHEGLYRKIREYLTRM